MNTDDIFTIGIPFCLFLFMGIGIFLWQAKGNSRYRKRLARVTNRKAGMSVVKATDILSLRRKSQESKLPLIGKILNSLTSQQLLHARLEKAALPIAADVYLIASLGIATCTALLMIAMKQRVILGIIAGFTVGVIIPHLVVGFLGKNRIKKFLILFPDALEFIVRGLRSGLPVTESMTIVASEMEEPIRGVFAGVTESVRLGVSVEKSLHAAAKKLQSTEFNFFVTSIILQTETGGNLAEILNNLAEVLRKRLMMRMKIKALSSEAKASAIIVGSLPFVVILALTFLTPGYLDILVDDFHGNIVAGGAFCSLLLGIGIMFKMSQFEI